MFSNFLYFLVALVIYTTADLFTKPGGGELSGLYASIGLGVLFALVCRFSFKRLSRNRQTLTMAGMDREVNRTISRLSILALMLFAVNIYFYRLNQLVADFILFQWIPTLEAIVFLAVFLGYLVLIWNGAYGIQKRYFPGHMTQKAFIFSNISFSLPALLPWCFISLLADFLAVLPFDWAREFLNTTTGEVVYIFFFLTAISVFGPVLIQRLWGCRPLGPGYDRYKIEATCRKAGLKFNNILKWELFGGSMITAGVMGIVGRFRYILVTPALLNSLDDDEIEGVILHEIGHVRYHHMLFYLLFFAGFVACNLVFFEPFYLILYVAQPLYRVFEFVGISRETAHPIMICAGIIGVFLIYFRLIFGVYMRHFERQADLHIFNFQPGPSALISTFYKIASLSRQSIDKPNWHHFSIGERIRFLEQCRENPGLIFQHHARVKKMIAAYVLIAGALFFLGYSISYGELNKPFGQYIAGKVLARELALESENSDLYVFVGDYYYNDDLYTKARDAYENVLKIDPENVHALNNLAWLLVTCPDKTLLDPVRALDLAVRALDIKQEAFIFDTYAEALFLNHRRAEALDAARRAMGMAQDKLEYYQGQVSRFEAAL